LTIWKGVGDTEPADILALLKKCRTGFVSGEEICKKMGVSRTAVWKHVRTLREKGYAIEAVTRLGYRLTGIPDRLYPEEILDGLNTEYMGRRIFYYESIGSTNQAAAKQAAAGAPSGSLVVAEEQDGGMGRLGRNWFSPKGLGIWCSLVLRPEISPEEASQATLLVAAAVAAALEGVTGVNPDIKWPNDLLAGGKKICGILCEMSAEMDKVNFLVAGIGINVNTPSEAFTEEIKETAASLYMIKHERFSRVIILRQVLREIERCLEVWSLSGFDPILADWKKRCINLGRPVRVNTLKETLAGIAEDVDSTGALILRLPDGTTRRLIAGEVTLANTEMLKGRNIEYRSQKSGVRSQKF